MRAVLCSEFAPLDRLQIVEPEPQPCGPGQVRIDVTAAGGDGGNGTLTTGGASGGNGGNATIANAAQGNTTGSLTSRDGRGGTAPKRVAEQLGELTAVLEGFRAFSAQ